MGEVDVKKHYKKYSQFLSGLNIGQLDPRKPVTLQQIKRIVKDNKKYLNNLQVNILGLLDGEDIYKYETNIGTRNDTNCLNLLSIPLRDIENGKRFQEHLVPIKCLHKFLAQRTNDENSYNKFKKYCLGCLNGFTTEKSLKEHKLICGTYACTYIFSFSICYNNF